jgi:FKBP-type peptidyl-prolyl cis-trans isomerase
MLLRFTKRVALAGFICLVPLGHAAAEDGPKMKFETNEAKASYGLGYSYGSSLKSQAQALNLDPKAIAAGVLDSISGVESRVSDQQVQEAMAVMQNKLRQIMQAEQAQASKAVRAEGEAYRQKNGKKPGVTTTASGLQYEVLRRGDSNEHPSASSKVNVHYHGTLIDGTVFDSSVDRGEPISFGLNAVIKGWTEGVQLMSPGDKFRFVIPANLAYGDRQASPKIPPGSTLIFEVELLDIL